MPGGRAAFEGVRQHRQRQRRHQARPDDQREHVRLVLARGVLGDDVADAHANAATITSTKPINVPVLLLANL